MAMVIAWHILNKVANQQDVLFSENILVMAPGLTVKKRLAVLEPSAEGNYYEAFDIEPSPLLDELPQGKVPVNIEAAERAGECLRPCCRVHPATRAGVGDGPILGRLMAHSRSCLPK